MAAVELWGGALAAGSACSHAKAMVVELNFYVLGFRVQGLGFRVWFF